MNPKELDLAKLLVSALAAKFDPTNLKDAFEERLREFIQKRADTAIAAYERGEAKKPAAVVDIMEALRKSMDMAVNRQSVKKSQPTRRQAGSKRVRRSR